MEVYYNCGYINCNNNAKTICSGCSLSICDGCRYESGYYRKDYSCELKCGRYRCSDCVDGYDDYFYKRTKERFICLPCVNESIKTKKECQQLKLQLKLYPYLIPVLSNIVTEYLIALCR